MTTGKACLKAESRAVRMQSSMSRVVLVLSLFGLLLLTACGAVNVYVYNDNDRRIGEIVLLDEKTATLLNSYGDERAKVRGNIVRDDQGKRIGTVILKDDGTVLLQNGDGEEVGSLDDGTECYGKGNAMIGRLSADVGPEVGGAACLVFFLQ